MSAFKKIADASATGGGSNIRDGLYKFLVEKVTYQKGHSGEVFIAELRVLESSATGAVDEQGRPVIPNAVGSSCSMVCNLTKHESAAGNAKAFAVAALGGLGFPAEKIDEDMLMRICGPTNPLRGCAVIDETYRGVNKGRSNPANAGKPLTLNKWKSIAQTGDDVKTARAYLDSNAAKVDNTPPAPMPAQAAAPVQAPAAAPAPVQAAPAPAPTPSASASADILAGLGIK